MSAGANSDQYTPVLLWGANGTPLIGGAGDARAASEVGLLTDARLHGFDGTTWDRLRANSLFDLKVQPREVIPVTFTQAANTLTTLTLPAGGAGIFTYLVYLQIVLYATAALTGGATPTLVTSTNLPGSPVWTFPTAGAIGTIPSEQKYEGGYPLKGSAAATAITIVAPATASVIWRINAAYFLA